MKIVQVILFIFVLGTKFRQNLAMADTGYGFTDYTSGTSNQDWATSNTYGDPPAGQYGGGASSNPDRYGSTSGSISADQARGASWDINGADAADSYVAASNSHQFGAPAADAYSNSYSTLPSDWQRTSNNNNYDNQDNKDNKGKHSSLFAEIHPQRNEGKGKDGKDDKDYTPPLSAPALYKTGAYIFGILRVAELFLFALLIPLYIYHRFFCYGNPASGLGIHRIGSVPTPAQKKEENLNSITNQVIKYL